MDEASDEYNYLYAKILDGYSEANENEKFEKLNQFIGFLSSIKQDLTREIFINKVSNLFDIDKQTLKGAISKYNNKHHKEKIINKKFAEPKIVVEEKKTDIKAHELEILRLIFSQTNDYQENAEFFDKYLTNPKAINFRDFLINKEASKFDKADEDYKYMLNYVMDDKNPILVSELKDKISLYERLEKRKNLRKRPMNSKGRDNEQR